MSENEGNEEKGFFQKILLRRSKSSGSSGSSGSNKKVWSPRRKSKRQPKASSFNKDKARPVQNGRRVIRATRPPSPTTEMSSIVSSDQDVTEVNSTSSAAMRGGNLPTIQNENLREKTEEWRQKRMEATAANQKEKKEKEIKQHRLKNVVKIGDGQEGEGKELEDNNHNSEEKKIADIEVSDIFKTRTFHPEHKRKADSYDPVEKKKKLDEVEQAAEIDKEEGAVVKKSNTPKLPSWINIVVPAALVATCAVIMMKTLRKK